MSRSLTLVISASLFLTTIPFFNVWAGDREKVIVSQCALESGGEPAVFAYCAANGLAMQELKNCLNGSCFGENNEIVKFQTWIGKTFFGSCGFDFRQGEDRHFTVFNNSNVHVTYTIEPEIAGNSQSTIRPGSWDFWTLDTCDSWVNIHGVGESYGFESGGVMEFAGGIDGYVHQYSMTQK